MSPVVRLTANSSFDDSSARAAMGRYCAQQNWEFEFGDPYAKVDMFAKTGKPDGTNNPYIGLELICNACWTTQEVYPEAHVHIPRRKWKTFYKQTKDVSNENINRAKRSYVVVFNVAYTRAAIMCFSQILEPLALFEEIVLNIHDKQDIFVLVPTSYIKKYIDIPPVQEETMV